MDHVTDWDSVGLAKCSILQQVVRARLKASLSLFALLLHYNSRLCPSSIFPIRDISNSTRESFKFVNVVEAWFISSLFANEYMANLAELLLVEWHSWGHVVQMHCPCYDSMIVFGSFVEWNWFLPSHSQCVSCLVSNFVFSDPKYILGTSISISLKSVPM